MIYQANQARKTAVINSHMINENESEKFNAVLSQGN